MSCQTLEVGLEQNARPQGMLAQDARPQADTVCRSYDFGGFSFIATFVSQNVIYSFAGQPMKVMQ